jgi:hypothetical protein
MNLQEITPGDQGGSRSLVLAIARAEGGLGACSFDCQAFDQSIR